MTDPRVFGSLVLLPSESPANADVSWVSPITSSPQFSSKIIQQFFGHPWTALVFVGFLHYFALSTCPKLSPVLLASASAQPWVKITRLLHHS